MEKDKLIAELDERYRLKKEGGVMVTERSDYCPTCGAPKEHRHLQTDLEIEKDRHQRDVEALTEAIEQLKSGHPGPEETIKHWLECPNCKPKYEALLEPRLTKAYDLGKTDTLANLKFDDVHPHFIGEWIKEARKREGK